MVNTEEKYKFGFEKLDVWKSSINLTKSIYLLTQIFPKDETYGLVSQIRRATLNYINSEQYNECRNDIGRTFQTTECI